MAIIAIDIDETLFPFDHTIRSVFFDMAEEYDDKSILRLAYSNNFEWRNLVDHDKKLAYEAIERVHSNTDLIDPLPYATQVVSRIADKHMIKYVGSRKDIHYDVTKKWLDIWFPEGELICADPQKPKNEYLKGCQYLIDDRPKTILEFLYSKDWSYYDGERRAFALWKPYNQNLTEVKNLYLSPTWRGLRYYLERKGVI